MFKMFGWVPDGLYDHVDYLMRYEIKDGTYTRCADKNWVNDVSKHDRLPEHFRKPWGEYPDMPRKK